LIFYSFHNTTMVLIAKKQPTLPSTMKSPQRTNPLPHPH
jgi:hypothetical protein